VFDPVMERHHRVTLGTNGVENFRSTLVKIQGKRNNCLWTQTNTCRLAKFGKWPGALHALRPRDRPSTDPVPRWADLQSPVFLFAFCLSLLCFRVVFPLSFSRFISSSRSFF
jgi:hypothetical protein